MKKNVMMRVAALLLVCVLASTCGISGTFAKYVTTNSGFEQARVAKWGVTIDATVNMFNDSYKDGFTTYTKPETGDGITVQSFTAGDNVVAPGTTGSLANFDIGGTPEVDVEVTYSATLTLTGWQISGVDYCPIVFTVTYQGISTDYYINKTTINDVAELKTAVEKAIADCVSRYDTNTDLATVEDDLVVSWRWEYEGEPTTATLYGYQFDAKDTKLGDQAADGNAATIRLDISCTITQVN